MLSPFETFKLNIYVSSLFGESLRDEEEETVLELDISQKMGQEAFVRYFLVKLNYTIIKDNQFDVCIKEKPLVSLKDKFLNILQNMESQETRVQNIGLLLYVASRLFLLQDGKRVYLISNLKSPLFAVCSTWENYFLFRINRKITDDVVTPKTGIQKAVGFIKAPLNLFSFGKSKPSVEEKESTRDAKSKKEFHPAIFMEIAQHLAMLGVAPDEATMVLIELFKKYEIGSNLMQSVFIVHQKAISTQFEEKIKMTVAPKFAQDRTISLSRLGRVLLRVLPYLSIRDTLTATMISRSVTRELTKSGYFSILRHHSLTPYQRMSVYKMLTFKFHEVASGHQRSAEVDRLKPAEECVLSFDLQRVIDFDVKRTTRDPVLAAVRVA